MEGKCLNCSMEYAGNFCPECGQKKNTHKYTLATILHDVPHSVLHVDKGFLYTFKQLIYRPGHAIREFIQGKRVNHFAPFAYLLLLCAMRTFIDHWVDAYKHKEFFMNPYILFPEVALFFDHYPALMLCLLAPFLSLWSWIFNLDSRYNYWENFVLNIYLMAQFNLFFIMVKLIYLFTGFEFKKATPMLLCFIAYLVFAYWQFFPKRHGVLPSLKRIIMFMLIIVTFLTGLSLTGFMTQWWSQPTKARTEVIKLTE